MDAQLIIAQFFSSRDLRAAFYPESTSPIQKDKPQHQKLELETKMLDEHSKKSGFSLSLTGKFNYSRMHVARWHAFVAGALAGFSVLSEKGEQRTMIAQQMFVRYERVLKTSPILNRRCESGDCKAPGTLGVRDGEYMFPTDLSLYSAYGRRYQLNKRLTAN